MKLRIHSLKLLVVILVVCCAVVSCEQKRNERCTMAKAIVKVKEVIKPLDDSSSEYPDSIIDYFKFYGLDFDSNNVEHIFGTFESGEFTLVGHIYKPQKYRATVFVLHGYFDHCGQLNHLIEYLLKAGYAVAAFDLPGLGLSSGRRAAIDNFSQYSRALIDFTDKVRPQLKGPYHFVGHSTGAAAVLDYLLCSNSNDTIFDRVVLIAPLIHCTSWEKSKLGYNKKIRFIKSIPRIFCKNSSNADFLDFVKNKDPLQNRTMPLKWVRALHKWNEKIDDLPASEKSVKIIQGTSDKTVDWRFNIKFIQEKFKDVEVSLIENANHELFNESANMRKEVFSQINHYLKEQ